MRNVEIKAYVEDYDGICKIAEELSGGGPKLLNQTDTFFIVKNGRLKMRYEDSRYTLVRYSREDEQGPKMSDYELLHFSQDESDKGKLLDEMLAKSLGVCGKVVKERKLYMVGQTRIHIDKVEGLGNYMELEVVLTPDQTLEEGQAIAKDLQKKLLIKDDMLIKYAYLDLLERKAKSEKS